MPGDDKKHADLISGTGVKVKLESYWKSDDEFDQDDFDSEFNSDSADDNLDSDELDNSTSTDDIDIDCSDENSSNVNPAIAD